MNERRDAYIIINETLSKIFTSLKRHSESILQTEKQRNRETEKERKNRKHRNLSGLVDQRNAKLRAFKFPPFFISLSSAAFSYFTYDVAFNTIQNTPPSILTDQTHSPYPQPTGNPLSANPQFHVYALFQICSPRLSYEFHASPYTAFSSSLTKNSLHFEKNFLTKFDVTKRNIRCDSLRFLVFRCISLRLKHENILSEVTKEIFTSEQIPWRNYRLIGSSSE